MAEENRGYGRAGRIGKIIKGKWRVDARLGEGATATVYAATHRNGHRVALKVLHPQFLRDAQIRTRFMREAYVGNAISHPGVVRVVDDDVTEDGAVFLVMELLEGESFERRAERLGGRLAVAEVVWMLDTLLDVLSAAHNRNIVHRDIKPDNLFLTRDGRIKVLDFGFARMKEEVERGAASEGATSLTKTGFILGTPDFMSPEQAGGRNKSVDGRSDLWSAAATAFCLITGQRVHPGAVTLHQHLLLTATARARSLGSIAPDLPSGLIAVIDRALMLEPDRRWTDATAMRTALRAAVGSFDGPPSALSHDGDTTAVYRGLPAPPIKEGAQEVRLDESVIFVSSQELLPSIATGHHAPYTAPPIADLPVPSMARSAVPVFAAPDVDGLMRPPEISRSSITARRIRPSAFDPYFSKWIFFLVIVTISAVVFIIGLRRKKHLDRHPISFSAQTGTVPQAGPGAVPSVLPQGATPAATLAPRPASTTPRK
ncbi:serine/threonine protein kinase [Pendulispora rubella]|uniref:Serine/threonine protein kinase n=1 Tax=Pendulispora rubella TaxID=2741070 RepID=A0ABZ2LHI3_9BACT